MVAGQVLVRTGNRGPDTLRQLATRPLNDEVDEWIGGCPNVAAISTARRNILTHVSLKPNEENGLREPASVKCEQLLTVSKERLIERIGQIDEFSMMSVEFAIKLALALP